MNSGTTTAILATFSLLCTVASADIATVGVGATAPDFTLPSIGQSGDVTLSEFADSNLTVVMWIATRCPVSNDYNERMEALADDYRDKGVAFVGVNANKTESTEECVQHAQIHGFSFAVVKDDGNRVADQYGARVTPEVFVLDSKRVVKYHGRIDDSREISRVRPTIFVRLWMRSWRATIRLDQRLVRLDAV